MRQPFRFHAVTRAKARLRQLSFCAGCGVELANQEEHTHHVIPTSRGNPRNPEHAWLKSLDNCVVLCGACHRRVPAGDPFANGCPALPSPYPFSHGGNAAAHAAWQHELASRSRLIARERFTPVGPPNLAPRPGAATAPASPRSTPRMPE